MPSVSAVVSSHCASAFLDDILTRWTARRQDIRRDNERHVDRLAQAVRELDDRRSQAKKRRHEEWEIIEEANRISEAGWVGRLRRIEEWTTGLSALQKQFGEIDGTVSGIRWFDRACRVAKHLAANLGSRITRLEQQHSELHELLEQWLPRLASKEEELKGFKKKAQEAPEPLLVSRGRKQPELDFLAEHLAADADIGGRLGRLRKVVGLSLNRLYSAARQTESRARVNERLFQHSREQITDELSDIQNQYFGLREKILADALLYESCRRKLRFIDQSVKEIRCIEDVYRPQEPVWKKMLNPLLRLQQ